MAYFLNLFTPDTWRTFREKGGGISGFRKRQRRLAERVHRGDIFLCYLTRLSRWCGALEVQSEVYDDDSPIYDDPDPYTARFRVKPIVTLDPESAIPIQDDEVWRTLTVTRQYERGYPYWTGPFRTSLKGFDDGDGDYLLGLLKGQQASAKSYPLSEKDKRHLASKRRVRTLDREVEVEVPDETDADVGSDQTTDGPERTSESSESIRMQAKVARIGAAMRFRIWVPRNNKAQVLEHMPADIHEHFLDELPLNYDDTTLRTIEQIDVLWLKGRSMARAFEIEHTTAIYSGLLRMADLLALQPNMDIHLHIVAPDERREKVLREIRRPVFSLLERGPLYEQCSFLSYSSINALAETQYLSHMGDTIIGEYEESTEV